MARRNFEAPIQESQELKLEGRVISCTLPSSYTKLETYKEISTGNIEGIYSLQYSPDGSTLAVGTGKDAVRLYDSASGKHLGNARGTMYRGLPVRGLKWHPRNHHILFAAACDGGIYALDTNSLSCTKVAQEKDNHIYALDFSADGTTFATAGKDLTVRVYDSKTCQMVQCYEGFDYDRPPGETECPDGHGMRVYAVRYHNYNDDILLTAGWGNHIKVWDIRISEGVRRTIAGPHICGDALDLKEFQILTGSWTAENALQLWDYSSGKLIKNIPFPSDIRGEYIYGAQFCANDTVVAGGSGTRSVKAINIVSNEVLGEVALGRCVNALDTTRGGQLVAVGGMADCMKIGLMS